MPRLSSGEYVNNAGYVYVTNTSTTPVNHKGRPGRLGSVVVPLWNFRPFYQTGLRTNAINGAFHGGKNRSGKPKQLYFILRSNYNTPGSGVYIFNKKTMLPDNAIKNIINAEHKLRMINRNRAIRQGLNLESHERPIRAILSYKQSPWYTKSRMPGTMTNQRLGEARNFVYRTGGTLGGFKKGGKIPKAGLYKLHKGEVVVPAHRVKTVDKALRKDGKKPLKKVCKNCVLTKKQLTTRRVSSTSSRR